MALILDTSAIMGLAFDDEDGQYARGVIDHIAADRAVVPTLFWFEIRNCLLMAERRQHTAMDQTTAFLADLEPLALEVDHHPQETIVLSLARRHILTVYDAAYLELAKRRNLTLATIDKALIKAAAAAGVAIWQPHA
jgi:predicted nucleic acid-binding protein